MKLDAAVDLFRRGEISLLRAAELAETDFATFRRVLQDRGVVWEVDAEPAEDLDRATAGCFETVNSAKPDDEVAAAAWREAVGRRWEEVHRGAVRPVLLDDVLAEGERILDAPE